MTNETIFNNPNTVTFTLTDTAAGALCLDDMTMYRAGSWSIQRIGAWTEYRRVMWKITATRATAKLMLDDAQTRSTKDGGYDQPASWYRSCRIAAETIKMALAQ